MCFLMLLTNERLGEQLIKSDNPQVCGQKDRTSSKEEPAMPPGRTECLASKLGDLISPSSRSDIHEVRSKNKENCIGGK